MEVRRAEGGGQGLPRGPGTLSPSTLCLHPEPVSREGPFSMGMASDLGTCRPSRGLGSETQVPS